MFNQLFPQRADNIYRGHKVALWILGLVVLMRILMSAQAVFNGANVAKSADGIPLDTYPTAAVQTILALFALLGFAQFMLCLVAIVVLARYRSLVPLMFALFLVYQLVSRVILRMLPIVRTGTPPGFYVTLGLLVLVIAGLALSMWRRGEVEASE